MLRLYFNIEDAIKLIKSPELADEIINKIKNQHPKVEARRYADSVVILIDIPKGLDFENIKSSIENQFDCFIDRCDAHVP